LLEELIQLPFFMNLTKVVAVAALLLSDFAVANAKAGSRGFVLISKALGNPFFTEVERGAKEEANKIGCTVVHLGPAEADQTGQIQILRDVIVKGTDGIAISAVNGDALVRPIEEARAKGIPVVTFDSDSPNSKRQAYIGTNNFQGGVFAGNAFKDLMPKNGSYAVLTGTLASINLSERIQGFKKAIGEDYNEVSGSPFSCEDSVPKSIQLIQDTLTKYPNLDGFFFAGGWPLLAGDAYIKALGSRGPEVKTKKFIVVSFDTLPPILQVLRQGYANALVGQRPAEMGAKSIDVLMAICDKKPIQTLYDTGVDLVLPENVDRFIKK
jgi:ribose transport system substrate-binding protein